MLLGWVVVMSILPQLVSYLHYIFIKPQAQISAAVFRVFDYDVVESYGNLPCHAHIRVDDLSGVCIGTGCSGLELFFLFSGFIILISGSWKNKIWFVPLGVVIIFLLNVIRIILLILINYHYPQYLHFNHTYTLVIIVYIAIFGLWMIWIKKYSHIKPTKN